MEAIKKILRLENMLSIYVYFVKHLSVSILISFMLIKEECIQKENTNFRQPICVKEILAVIFPYLASADSQQSLGWANRIGKATISKIIKETTNATWEVLKEVYLKPPHEVADWKSISKESENLWNFPHCIGAIEGKHVAIECRKLSGTKYFNFIARNLQCKILFYLC